MNAQFKKRRLGCLGSLVAFGVLGSLTYLSILAVFAPWSFFLGGQFHIIPAWRAWGRLHSPAEGDYLLFVQLSPAPGTRGVAHVTGWADLCSPRGVIHKLTLGGDMERHMWLETDRKHMFLYMYHRGWFYGAFDTERRPRIDLHGEWHVPVLELDDHGSLSRAFGPDGTLYLGRRPATRWTAHLTLRAGSYSDFAAACRANVVQQGVGTDFAGSQK